ncbi:hypothetical protein BDA99DRAFT_538829 [Phascolomyces articulosus]|uniref:Uncharacterized protein n=1 Tax=Phascolomyces articulosus TaxID=60185 RepID=A0AAD5PE89_9FUNG|nr:hypothetical protein BDA99DRAFT_538829 [Phascolomyces articulosus]
MSGTSTAIPYLSGSIALYMQATGSPSPGQIFQVLLNHAQPVKTLRIRNKSSVQRISHLEHPPAAVIIGAVLRNRPLHVNANATIHFESSELTLEPNSPKTVHIQSIPLHSDPSTASPRHQSYPQHLLYGSYIKISLKAAMLKKVQELQQQHEEDEKCTHIPYLGASDNQRDLPYLIPCKKKATVQRCVPPGVYKIRVSALKIFGNPLLKVDWEIWYYSPEFEII